MIKHAICGDCHYPFQRDSTEWWEIRCPGCYAKFKASSERYKWERRWRPDYDNPRPSNAPAPQRMT